MKSDAFILKSLEALNGKESSQNVKDANVERWILGLYYKEKL